MKVKELMALLETVCDTVKNARELEVRVVESGDSLGDTQGLSSDCGYSLDSRSSLENMNLDSLVLYLE